jgi:hypothetical protein
VELPDGTGLVLAARAILVDDLRVRAALAAAAGYSGLGLRYDDYAGARSVGVFDLIGFVRAIDAIGVTGAVLSRGPLNPLPRHRACGGGSGGRARHHKNSDRCSRD